MKPIYAILITAFFFACNRNSDVIDLKNHLHDKEAIDSLIKLSDAQSNNVIVVDKHLDDALFLALKSSNDKAIYDIYVLIAQRYRNISEYSKALEYLQLAQEIANKLNDDELRAYTTHETAVNFRRIGDYSQALKFHIQALEWSENAKDTFLIHCSLNGIGNVHFAYKEYEEAIDYFHQSLNFLGKKEPNLLGEAINTNTIGESWLFLGNADSALHYLERSLQVNFYIESELGQAICFNGIGMVYHEKKDYINAIKSYHSALEIYEKIGDLFYETMCLNNLGKTYYSIHEYTNAQNTFEKSFQIASSIGSKRHALEAAIELTKLYHTTNKPHRAYAYNLKSMAYKDTITKELREQNSKAMNVLYEAEKQKREILILKQEKELQNLKINRQKYFFISSATLLIIALFFGVFLYRQRQLRSRVNEIGLEQKLLRAQLNPHFIFNSLSAIQNFIMKNDKVLASEYLVNFSRLMRNILMGSADEFINLSNEIEILDDYLRLQRLRYLEKFDFFFEIDDSIDPQDCLVPAMLIQPFVENSIEHGIRDIENQGLIFIRFIKESNYLIIEVEDNGRGLQEQQEKKHGHVSMATKITRQRLQNLQAVLKQKCHFKIQDRKAITNENGVIVTIKLPFKFDD